VRHALPLGEPIIPRHASLGGAGPSATHTAAQRKERTKVSLPWARLKGPNMARAGGCE